MKKEYSTLCGHFEKPIPWDVGDIIQPGQVVGRIGTTGVSTIIHCHLGTVLGRQKKLFKVADFEAGRVTAAPEQTQLLISGNYRDIGLFGCEPIIWPVFMSSEYLEIMKYNHWGTDVRPIKPEMKDLHLNRSFSWEVLAKGVDNGYGNYGIFGYKV